MGKKISASEASRAVDWGGERAAETGDMHAFDDWSNVFMLIDSRCC